MNFYSFVSNEGVSLERVEGNATSIYVPTTVRSSNGSHYPVIAIGPLAFASVTTPIHRVVFAEDSKISIFMPNCFISSQIRVITMPASLKSIPYDENIFQNIHELNVDPRNKFFTQDKNGLVFLNHPFELIFVNKRVKDVFLRESLHKIWKFAFRGCNRLRKIAFPSSLERIESFAFIGCEWLLSIYFPKDSKLVSIGPNAFYGCPFKRIRLPASLKIIEDHAFCNCLRLKYVELGKSINQIKIGEEPFGNGNVIITVKPDYP